MSLWLVANWSGYTATAFSLPLHASQSATRATRRLQTSNLSSVNHLAHLENKPSDKWQIHVFSSKVWIHCQIWRSWQKPWDSLLLKLIVPTEQGDQFKEKLGSSVICCISEQSDIYTGAARAAKTSKQLTTLHFLFFFSLLFFPFCYWLFPLKAGSAATEHMVSRGRSLEEGNHSSPQRSSRWLFPPLNYLQWRHEIPFKVLPRLALHNYIAMNWSAIRFTCVHEPQCMK